MKKKHDNRSLTRIVLFHILQLEQMELEIKDLPGKDKQKYRTRLTSYKAELSKLQADLVLGM